MLSTDPNTGAVTVVQDIDRESLSENDLRLIVSVQDEPKGQLISKCPFGVFKSLKKTNEISALASKKTSNQKSSVRE